MKTQSTQQPAHSIRYGNVRAAIWKNENGYHNVTVERSYKKDEQWATSDSFGRDDLPKLEAALREAYAWIFRTSQTSDSSDQ